MCAISRWTWALGVVVTACAANPAPRGVLPDARGALHHSRGAWTVAETLAGKTFQGELIAASADTLWVHDSTLLALPRADLKRAQFAVFDAHAAALGLWTALGAVATIGNGFFLVFTMPMWLGGGVSTTVRASKQPLHDWLPWQSLEDFARFARFPAGIPPSVDRSSIE